MITTARLGETYFSVSVAHVLLLPPFLVLLYQADSFCLYFYFIAGLSSQAGYATVIGSRAWLGGSSRFGSG